MSGHHSESVRTNVIWEALAWTGYEHLCLEEWDYGYTVDGLIVGALQDRPARVWYRLNIAENWELRSLHLAQMLEMDIHGDAPIDLYEQSVKLERPDDGEWRHDLFDEGPDLSACTDIDIAVTPFTNTLPIRRLELPVGESAEIDVVYLAVPELSLVPARQSYTRLADRSYRFESLSSGFTADITVDDSGLVTDYPGLFRRVWPEPKLTSESDS